MVVGDADQSIYAFRGADIRNIIDFEQDFPDATTILLEQNYRSTQTILTAANSVIGNNRGRKAKRLWTDAGAGERIVGYVSDDEHDEARFVSQEIDRSSTPDDVRPADVAVFYRTNAQSRVFEEVFIRTGQPYKVVGGVRFYERKEVRDALAYLRMLVNTADEISLRRVLNTPKRGIGERAEACIAALADRDRITFWEALTRAAEAPGLATRSLRNIEAFVAIVQELQSMVAADERPDVILESVLERSTLLAELEASEDPQDATRVENLAELVAVAREFAEDPQPGPSADPAEVEAGTVAVGLGDFLERVALVADADQIPDAPDGDDSGVVTLMTLHTAKGLEFPVVFLTGLEDGVFPHQRALGRPARAGGGAPARLRRHSPVPAKRLYLSRALGPVSVGGAEPQPGQPVPRRAPGRPRRLASHRGRADALGTGRPHRWVGHPPGQPHRRRPAQLLLRCHAGRRGRQGQARARDPESLARRPGRPRLVRHGHRRRRRRGRGEVRRLDRLRLRRGQAAAAQVCAGGEALALPLVEQRAQAAAG
jgi:DNA helicase II / ATP-dependent DNA helicase PcrA